MQDSNTHTLPTTIAEAMTQHYSLAAQELDMAAIELRELLDTAVNDLRKNLSVGNAIDADSIASVLSTVVEVRDQLAEHDRWTQVMQSGLDHHPATKDLQAQGGQPNDRETQAS